MDSWLLIVAGSAVAEIRRLPTDMQARFVHIAELLAAFGPYRVGMPHVRPLRDKL
jgi:hypothetical protein